MTVHVTTRHDVRLMHSRRRHEAPRSRPSAASLPRAQCAAHSETQQCSDGHLNTNNTHTAINTRADLDVGVVIDATDAHIETHEPVPQHTPPSPSEAPCRRETLTGSASRGRRTATGACARWHPPTPAPRHAATRPPPPVPAHDRGQRCTHTRRRGVTQRADVTTEGRHYSRKGVKSTAATGSWGKQAVRGWRHNAPKAPRVLPRDREAEVECPRASSSSGSAPFTVGTTNTQQQHHKHHSTRRRTIVLRDPWPSTVRDTTHPQLPCQLRHIVTALAHDRAIGAGGTANTRSSITHSILVSCTNR
jgi:hypothetical protein